MANFFSKFFKSTEVVEDNEEIVDNEEIEAILEKEIIEDQIESIDEEDNEQININYEETKNKNDFFSRLKDGLFKTRNNITEKINDVLKSFKTIDEDLYEQLEEILITSDVGVETTMKIIDNLRIKVKEKKVKDANEVKDILKEELVQIMGNDSQKLSDITPQVIIVIGVNGVGKTTSIGKISYRLKKQGKKVLIAAADTFRAAAIDQLEVWAKRANVDIVKHQEGADPAAVIFDAINSAKSKKVDVVICDTAGRLHNKKNLMEELKKVFRVLDREYPEAHKEVLLVLDATTGQNAIAQAKEFKEAASITGIVLTKLDGTAKGGIVIAIRDELGVPVKLVGVGEKAEDLQDFHPKDFVEALFSE